MASTRVSLPLVQSQQRPTRVVLSEPMLRYRCNRKGCCCRGWDIPFKLDDFVRLFEHLSEEERGELGAGIELLVDEAPEGATEDLLLRSLKLAGVGEDRHCRFCESDGGCKVHAKYGISALPDICVDFPAHGFRDAESGEVELYWDPVCPEVVRLFAEEDGQLGLGTVETPAGAELSSSASASSSANAGANLEMGWHDPGFAQRVANAKEELVAHVEGVRVSRAELEHIRGSSIRALGDRSRPTWEQLASVLNGFRALAPGRAMEFEAKAPDDLEAFQNYLGGCIGAHGPPVLLWALEKMERFVHAIDLKPILAERTKLVAGLAAWGDALDQWYFPQEEALRPIFSRYLQHRFGMPYANQEGNLREAADTIALLFSAALRYAGGIAAALERPVDSGIAQAGIAAAEYLYRTLHFSAEILPWYASADGRARAPSKD